MVRAQGLLGRGKGLPRCLRGWGRGGRKGGGGLGWNGAVRVGSAL